MNIVNLMESNCTVTCVLLLCLSFLGTTCCVSSSTVVRSADAKTRANQTLLGLYEYYWTNDPKVKNIKFFYSCGQIGGNGSPKKWNQCSCDSRHQCVNCYRWWDAIAMESVATHGIYTKDKQRAYTAKVIFAHSPYNANWNVTAQCTFVDDFLWYAIAYLRVYEWLNDTKWLNHSIALYDWAWENGWDGDCGGLWWSTCKESKFKDSITILEFLHLSSKLAYMFPNKTKYLNESEKIWNWLFSFDNGYGLMSDSYLVSTGAVPERCCNSTSSGNYSKCSNTKISGTSYNQGLLMSTSAFLYVSTGNETYLKVGMRALEAVITNYTTKQGVLIDEQRGFQSYQTECVYGEDPGGDYYSFNGVFMLHLAYFMETLANNKSLPPETFYKIKNLVEKTSDAAWTKSAVWPPFKKKDVCNISHTNPNVTYPKFHWWWGQDVLEQKILPPDPRQWFRKSTLRCYTLTESQLWEGMIGSEDKCREKCEKNSTCSKYLYQISPQSSVPGTDCWIWSYNRSDHICPQYDYNFITGILRPDPEASCAGKCGSKDPIKMKRGMCYCDHNCTKHFDCCLDYANHCLPHNSTTCKGLCTEYQTLYARVIPGGGYCWCDEGCRLDTCCIDYTQKCQKISIPPCLDARTQGSALNLFLAHVKLTELSHDYSYVTEG